ncbi:putative acyl-CoA dehydrogenase FadE17 [Sphaerisporangium rufum]|uniref:Acyl-CoA dehydrogenase FadE17 n=1 Tax=Sphaerisporangium rufum TaxID=1381558 RepID=A0A919R2U0_9ACTN|nr:acyl-CoA dehydrogenase family protein [Sphaerisporangium rufum]GII78559.1 putative acyl-CoA dehydrogenase FadE17 [Sphaerisporangium rufum]
MTIDSGDGRLDRLRAELREWLGEHRRPSLAGMGEYDLEREVWRNPESPLHDDFQAFEQASLAARLVCPQWPAEYGGRGLGELEMAVLAEEFARAGMPRVTRGMGERLAGPAILAHGTPEQRAYFLPRVVSGQDRYCQGFSEPDAGSDLAAVTTRGVVAGDEIVITGQKIWTSRAHLADTLFLLCRTDPAAPKHKGISYVLVPMKDNGITVTSLVTMSGEDAFCQEYIDGARAPLFNVIGGLNNGWRAAMTTLGSERGAVAAVQHLEYEEEWRALVARARELGRDTDPLVRQDLAWAYCQVHVMKATGRRVLASLAAGGRPGAEASLTKLVWSEYHRRLGEIAMEIEGAEGLVRPPGEGYPLTRWQKTFLTSRAETIFAGTSEVQRRIVAERVLGLPKSS